MRTKLDLIDLNNGLDHGEQDGLRISQAVDDLPHPQFLGLTENNVKEQQTSSEQQFFTAKTHF